MKVNMRIFRTIAGVGLFSLLAIAALTQRCEALDLFESRSDKMVTARYRINVAANISTAAVVIDLSDTVNWPHKDRREIRVNSIRLDVDKVSTSTFTAKVGVVNFVQASTGSVTWFRATESSANVSNTNVTDSSNYYPATLRLRVDSAGNATDGTTPYLISNDKTSGSTTYQTDVPLPSTNGNTAPGAGDVILFIQNGASAITGAIEIQYFTD